MARVAVAALLAAALLATPAAAEQRLVTITTASVHVDPRRTVFNGPPPEVLKANVLLPDGYDGRRAFPLLLLLHGVGDAYDTWARPDRGAIAGR